jgi:hypothetical protein
MPLPKDTWAKLAIRLRVSRTAIHDWRQLPGAPQEPDPEKWKEFVQANGLGQAGNQTSGQREELLTIAVEKRNRLLDLQIAREERKSVDRGEVDAMLLNVASLQKTVLYPALERELPAKAEGKTAVEIAVIGREIADRICETLSGAVESWKRA